ncbi:MAG: hypothetical protein BWY46_00824 [Firmicutes bacterium ADurb.Bin300]|nr:MAG: hypothetical protein BWY46_00824 [Firmicutes bacterium ADurb.Bin300]
MSRNIKIETSKKLLDENGELSCAGWANHLILEYNPENIRANKLRIKEWDYYLITSSEGNYALSFCIADNRYMGLVNAAVMDLNTKEKFDFLEPLIFPMGSLKLPRTSETGNIAFRSKHCYFHIDKTKNITHIYCKFTRCYMHSDFEADIFLEKPPSDTMVIATPWATDKKAFYYNQKITCMRAKGYAKIKRKEYVFDNTKDFGILDWGRGVWTYDNTWYWGIGSGKVNGKDFGYNIGYGFGDTSAASENMLFYDGKSHKLDLIDFGVGFDVMKKWHITSNDNRFKGEFFPEFNDRTDLSLGFVSQRADKLFGRINATAVLDDGTTLNIENMLVFHEIVHNRY